MLSAGERQEFDQEGTSGNWSKQEILWIVLQGDTFYHTILSSFWNASSLIAQTGEF